MSLRLKRIYAPPAAADGARILVDRLWPRGITKEQANLTLWLKDVAPSHELRRWFAHDPDKWAVFKQRYFAELTTQAHHIAALRERAKQQAITLLFAAKDEVHNHAAALREYLQSKP